ncbi:MAG: PPOX class F420-dependent oxidoreductase [Nitrososphaerales archaeon]|jgi:PPOX class probable F420-dependent enzyme
MDSTVEQFASAKQIILESYKKNGTPMQTLVGVVVDNGTVYVRTGMKTWKARRIKMNPRVRIDPSSMRMPPGKPAGTWVEGEAHFVTDVEVSSRMQRLFKKKYGLVGRIIEFFYRLRAYPKNN